MVYQNQLYYDQLTYRLIPVVHTPYLIYQGEIYKSFTSIVKNRRGDKLKLPDNELFTGEFWTGQKSLELGLIDGIGELTTVMQERYSDRVQFRPISERKSWLKQRFAVLLSSRQPSFSGIASEVISVVEERAIWARFGL